MLNLYNDTVLDHFTNPRNVGSFPDADGIGQSGNPADGDKITIYIKVHNKILVDVRFKTFGCGAAIAASSMLTVLAFGKSLETAMKITNDDVAKALKGLPPQKILCSNIAAEALHAAINDHLNRNKKKRTKSRNISEKTTEKFSDKKETNHGTMNKDQIQRYLRHIIMPEISGVGQKKLLETSVLICSQSIIACEVLLNYLTASGIGKIYCLLENKKGWDSLLVHLHDLNPDITIEITDTNNVLVDFNIIIGSFDFTTQMSNILNRANSHKFSPTLIGVTDAWEGYVSFSREMNLIVNFITEISEKHIFDKKILNQERFRETGIFMSTAFLGTFMVIELIKVQLNIGKLLNEPLYFNLWEMSFSNNFSSSEEKLQSSQLSFKQTKKSLSQTKALIVGTGGLGCPAALSLARVGIGTIGLVDYDYVELSNLNRQILHTTSKIGLQKVESAKQTLKMINPLLNVEVHPVAFSRENALNIINDYAIIINGLDNLPARYLLYDACFFMKKPYIEAGAISLYGQVTTIVPGKGPCYRCIFPESTTSNSTPSCSETGVLGPVPGLMGVLQAAEALKVIMGVESPLKGGLLIFDALGSEFEILKFQRNSDCKLCGENPSILDLGEYIFVCEEEMNK